MNSKKKQLQNEARELRKLINACDREIAQVMKMGPSEVAEMELGYLEEKMERLSSELTAILDELASL